MHATAGKAKVCQGLPLQQHQRECPRKPIPAEIPADKKIPGWVPEVHLRTPLGSHTRTLRRV